MVDVEASVTSASGADGSGCASSVARDKVALWLTGEDGPCLGGQSAGPDAAE
jgi:hypothetical protein